MKLGHLEVLSEAEIREIHEATVDILATCGVKIYSGKVVDFLGEKGLPVDAGKQTVLLSRDAVENALESIPRRFEVFDREGEPCFTLGDGESRFAAGHNAVNWVDSESGETRYSTVADVELFARICQQLACIDMIGIPVMPQDVPLPKATLLYGVRAVIENSTKPIFFSYESAKVNDAVIDMLAAAFAGDLEKRCYGISQLSPTSPLYWESGAVEALLDNAERGIPTAILPEPNAGVTAPYTLAGLLTMNNAECLSGFVILQLLKPRLPVMYANSWTTTDMLSGAALVGSIESTVCRIAGAQLARHYGVPSHTTAPNSDNHAHDEQSAWEKTLSAFCAAGAGNDLIVNCGMFAAGLTCSHEQLIMDEAMCAFARRITEGLDVSEETIARDLIKSIGPDGGTYLTTDHTLKWLRSKEYVDRRISVSGPYAAWKQTGAKDSYQLARDRVRKSRELEAPPFDEKRRAGIREIVSQFRP